MIIIIINYSTFLGTQSALHRGGISSTNHQCAASTPNTHQPTPITHVDYIFVVMIS